MRKILAIIFTIFTIALWAGNHSYAESAPFWISAVNAGYKNDSSSQNYDFIELSHGNEEEFLLDGYSLVYYNSSGNESGKIVFQPGQTLVSKRLVLGFAKSPQYLDYQGTVYAYNFGSSGLASTAGKLQLLHEDNLIDEVCWGKLTCQNQGHSFSTKEADNQSLIRAEEGFIEKKYYPNIEEVIVEPVVQEELPESCGVIMTEIFTYYTDSPVEQFVEFYNPTEIDQDISLCEYSYKNKIYPVTGIISPGAYYVYKNPELTYTKNPTVFNTYSLSGIDTLLPHGQKKGTSYALFNIGTESEKWLQTYQPTPGAENVYQEFQTCDDGKVINPETGNCVKEVAEEEITCPEGKYLNPLTGRCKNIPITKTTTCKEGYYLNPETGRCKKNPAAATVKECAEGYELNPDTNRCRKIRENTGMEYPVEETEEGSYDNPKIFIATGAVILLVVIGVIYVVYQYRKEIKQFILKICRRNAS